MPEEHLKSPDLGVGTLVVILLAEVSLPADFQAFFRALRAFSSAV